MAIRLERCHPVRRFAVAYHVSLEDAFELDAHCVPKHAGHSGRYKFNC